MVSETEGPEGTPEVEGKLKEIEEAEKAIPKLEEEPEDTGKPEEVTAEVEYEEDGEDDPIEAAVQERIKLELERKQEEFEEQARSKWAAERAEEARRSAALAEANSLRDSFVESLRESYNAIKAKKYFDEDGSEVVFSDNEFQQYVAEPMQKHNSKVQQIVQGTVLTQLADTALNTLPDEESRKAFTERATDKPLDEWLGSYAEARAPNTKFVKDLKAEVEAAKKAAYARGYARGQKGPVATPKQGVEVPGKEHSDLNTISGLLAAHRSGQIDDKEYYEKYKKLRG